MLTRSDRAVVDPILKSIGAHVYLIDVLGDGVFRYFTVNWAEGTDARLPYKGSVIGRRPEEIFDPEIAARTVRHYMQCVQQRTDVQFEGSFETAAGRSWTNHFLAPIFDLTGRIVRIMGTIIDITPQKRAEAALQESLRRSHELAQDLAYQASHDWLTGLVNRREFESRLRSLIDSAAREKSRHALCYLDLDQFRIINDTFGHVVGDELLRQIGMLLQDHVRKEDTVARLGGDEFGILAVNRTLDEAREMGLELCRVIEDHPFIGQGRKFNIGASIGIVPVSESSGRVVDLLRAADRACYAAKDKGRNRVHVYHEHDPDLKKKRGEMEWVNRINYAFSENRFHLYFQPIVPIHDMNTGAHFEMLLRFEDERGNMITPDEFLPAAEHFSLMEKIDRWVVHTAFRWLLDHPRQLEQLNLCTINLSGNSLADETFLNVVIGAFKDIPVPPAKICFEITETAAITNFASTVRFIRTLRELGCRFSLDDFGAGLSCFKYLTSFPVDYLKIDGSFIRDITANPVSRAIVKSITEVGHIMNKEIIAEYVENETTLHILREAGVDYYQGFMLSEPRPVQ